MRISVLVEPDSKNGYQASSPAFALRKQAATRDEALANVQAAIQERVNAGAEFVPLQIAPTPNARPGLDASPNGETLDADEALFLIPTNLSRPFFARLLQYCESRIDMIFGDQLRSVLRYVPRDEEDFRTDEVVRLLHREFRLSSRIRMLVVAPTGSKMLTHELVRAISQLENPIPVIAITIPFRSNAHFRKFNIAPPAFVICNSEWGARQLGTDAAKRLPKKLKQVHVVYIHGPRGRLDSRARVVGFRQGLETGENGVKRSYVESERLYCDWNGDLARVAFSNLVARESRPIHVVFAANDEMALGVRSAIESISGKYRKRVADCLIYGFDAIPEMKRLVYRDDQYIKGTVEQPLKKMADRLVGLMQVARQYPEKTDKLRGKFVDPIVHVFERSKSNSAPDAPPPAFERSKFWTLAKDSKRPFGMPKTLERYERELKDRRRDEHGEYGIHGATKIRKCRFVNGEIWWYVGG